MERGKQEEKKPDILKLWRISSADLNWKHFSWLWVVTEIHKLLQSEIVAAWNNLFPKITERNTPWQSEFVAFSPFQKSRSLDQV